MIQKVENEFRLVVDKDVEYIFFSDEFLDPVDVDQIMSPMPDLEEYEQKRRSMHVRLAKAMLSPSFNLNLIPMYQEPVLSKSQERHLFRQYNYLKYALKAMAENKGTNCVEVRNLHGQLIKLRDWLHLANTRIIADHMKRHCRWETRIKNRVATQLYICLLAAVERFNWLLGYKISTYAYTAIRRRANRECAKVAKRLEESKGVASDVDIVECRNGREIDLIDKADEVSHLLKFLSDDERLLVSKRFGMEGHRSHMLSELGDSCGLTKERIRQKLNAAYAKILSYCEEPECEVA